MRNVYSKINVQKNAQKQRHVAGVTVIIIYTNGMCSLAFNNYQTVLDYIWSPILLCI